MKVLFFTATVNACSIRLLDALLPTVPPENIDLTSDSKRFADALIASRAAAVAVILYLDSVRDAAQMQALQELLEGHFIIIVSGSRDSEMVAQCRQLYPRLLGFCDENPKIVAAVVETRLTKLDIYRIGWNHV